MSFASSYRIASDLHLVQQFVPMQAKPKIVDLPVHHIVVIDCSGSMSGDLPRIRTQLKNKLPMLLRDNDTISIVWFSSRGEYGTLIEALPVKSVTDLSGLNNAIDRFLRPVGLTGFKEPLVEVGTIITRISKKDTTGLFSLFFMSDGYDNQWAERDILNAVSELQDRLASAVFVEYGYYCNRPLMTKMAEHAGGALIFSENFNRYEPTFENAIQKRLGGAKKIEVAVEAVPAHGLVFSMIGGDLVTFALNNGKVLVPENVGTLWYLTDSAERIAVGEDNVASKIELGYRSASTFSSVPYVEAIYAAVALLAQRMQANDVFKLLKVLGDVKLITQFTNCFGKQKYSDFQEVATKAVFEPSVRFADGWNANLVPREDAFTVLDVLRLLSEDDGNKFFPDHPAFGYKRIGRKSVDAAEMLTESEQKEIADLTGKAKSPADLKKVQARMNEIIAAKPVALKFEEDEDADGYPVSNLVFNEDRPNVSAQVRKTGTVNVKAILTEDAKKANVPEQFPSFVYRNYTVIRDGILNVNVLPVKLTEASFDKLVSEKVIKTHDGDHAPSKYPPYYVSDMVYEIDLRSLPVINRKMVKSVSAKALFTQVYELTKARADQKVYKFYKEQNFGKRTSIGYAVQYGDAVAGWLKEQGITDYSGFNPKQVRADATDYYMGKELTVALKGLSSLPSVNDVLKRIESGKEPTASQAMLIPAIEAVKAYMETSAYKTASEDTRRSLLESWLDKMASTATRRVREALYEIAQIKFSIVVGQVWFNEFASLDENTMTLKVDGKELDCTVKMEEIKVEI